MNKNIKTLSLVLLFSILAYAAHMGLATLLGFNQSAQWQASGYTLEGLYAFQAGLSLVVVSFILMAQWAMPKNLGFIFLGLILVKAVASFIFINPGLERSGDKFLASQFLIAFFLFLFVDVFMAYRAINQAEPNPGTKF